MWTTEFHLIVKRINPNLYKKREHVYMLPFFVYTAANYLLTVLILSSSNCF